MTYTMLHTANNGPIKLQQRWHQLRQLRQLLTGITVSLGLSLSLGLAQTASAQQVDLGAAGQFAGFFFGDVTASAFDAEGRLALGGNLSIAAASVGGRVNPNDTRAALIVGGNVSSFNGGSIGSSTNNSYGTYSGTLGPTSKVPVYLDLRKAAVGPIDFEAERTYLSVLSQQLRTAPATGTVSRLYSDVTLTGSNKDVEIFNLTADQVKSGYSFILVNVKPTSYLILNLASDAQRTIKFGITMTAMSGRHDKVLVNMYDAELVNFTNVGVFGSILAPYGCVKNSSGHLEGTIVAASWNATMEIGNTLFVPSN